jgi:hypothetical protein
VGPVDPDADDLSGGRSHRLAIHTAAIELDLEVGTEGEHRPALLPLQRNQLLLSSLVDGLDWIHTSGTGLTTWAWPCMCWPPGAVPLAGSIVKATRILTLDVQLSGLGG